jgi:hypothetical protein
MKRHKKLGYLSQIGLSCPVCYLQVRPQPTWLGWGMLINIWLGWKGLYRSTNSNLFAHSINDEEKSVLTLTRGVNALKPLSVTYVDTKQARHLFLVGLSSQVHYFWVRPQPTWLGWGMLLALPINIWLGQKGLPRNTHFGLSVHNISDKEKKFFNIDTWCQCTQTSFLWH